MNEEARSFFKRLLKEGKRYDDVRRLLISEGYGTDGLEEAYITIQKELGIKEPPPKKPLVQTPPTSLIEEENAQKYIDAYKSRNVSRMTMNILKLLAGVLVIGGAAILFSRYGTELRGTLFGVNDTEMKTGLGPADAAKEVQLKSMQLSAEAYKAKLLDYRGLCESIGIDREVFICTANTDAYTIEAALSNDTYYCVDSSGFIGPTPTSHAGSFSCTQ